MTFLRSNNIDSKIRMNRETTSHRSSPSPISIILIILHSFVLLKMLLILKCILLNRILNTIANIKST